MSVFSELEGLTLEKIVRTEEDYHQDDVLTFVTECGRAFVMGHHQECCETVSIEDICGDLEDLIGVPVLSAYESTNCQQGPYDDRGCDGHTSTWTFYNISTIKGSVTIRWYGVSNGYYSESVDFCEVGR